MAQSASTGIGSTKSIGGLHNPWIKTELLRSVAKGGGGDPAVDRSTRRRRSRRGPCELSSRHLAAVHRRAVAAARDAAQIEASLELLRRQQPVLGGGVRTGGWPQHGSVERMERRRVQIIAGLGELLAKRGRDTARW